MLDIKKIGKKKIGKEKYPEKTSINLITEEKDMSDPKYQLGIFVVFLIILAIFVKFMVIDLVVDSYKAQSSYEKVQRQIEQLKLSNKDFAEVRAEYSEYGNGYLNDEEKTERSRIEIFSTVRTGIISKADVKSIDVAGNVAKVTIEGVSLDTVSSIVSSLEAIDSVSFVSVTTAGTNSGGSSSLAATLTINFKEAGGDK